MNCFHVSSIINFFRDFQYSPHSFRKFSQAPSEQNSTSDSIPNDLSGVLQQLETETSSIQSNRRAIEKKVLGLNIMLKFYMHGNSISKSAKLAEDLLRTWNQQLVFSYKTPLRAFKQSLESDCDLKEALTYFAPSVTPQSILEQIQIETLNKFRAISESKNLANPTTATLMDI